MAQPQLGLSDRDNDNHSHDNDLNHCQMRQALTLPCVCHPCSPLLVSLPAESVYSAKKGWSLFPHSRWSNTYMQLQLSRMNHFFYIFTTPSNNTLNARMKIAVKFEVSSSPSYVYFRYILQSRCWAVDMNHSFICPCLLSLNIPSSLNTTKASHSRWPRIAITYRFETSG